MIFDLIKRLAAQNPNGFTARIPSGELVTQGFAVSYEATQHSHDDDGLRKCIEHALTHDHIIGGWHNKADGKWYWDSSKILTDRDEAAAFGREQGQIAFYDLTHADEIPL